MSQRFDNRQQKERYEQAVTMAKRGQYSKARYLLQDMHNHPSARKLLQKIEGRDDKLRGGITSFFSTTLLIIIGASALVIALVWNSVGLIREQANQRAFVADQYDARGLEGGQPLFVDLSYMCYEIVGDFRDSCIDWGATALTEYQEPIRACVIIIADDGIQYRGQEETEVYNCLVENGMPPVPEA